jgi:hypothetical protein
VVSAGRLCRSWTYLGTAGDLQLLYVTFQQHVSSELPFAVSSGVGYFQRYLCLLLGRAMIQLVYIVYVICTSPSSSDLTRALAGLPGSMQHHCAAPVQCKASWHNKVKTRKT